MSIADRAAEVIEKVARESETPSLTGVYAVSALRQENLLAPDLPKPDRIKHKAITGWWGAAEYEDDTNLKVDIVDGEIYVCTDIRSFPETPDQARRLALALLAASNYVEEA